MKSVRALFFDLDGTLLDGSSYGQLIDRTCEKIAASHFPLDPVQLTEVYSMKRQEYWPETMEERTLGLLDTASVSLETWRRTLWECGCRDDSVVQYASRIYLQFERESHRLFDDVQEVFASAGKDHVPLALVTNGASDAQRDKLRSLGIEEWFDAVVISGEVGVAKPDPHIFELALTKLSLDPEYVWHVGDELTTDVAGAKAASLKTIWLNRYRNSRKDDSPKPDMEIQTLRDLLKIINFSVERISL